MESALLPGMLDPVPCLSCPVCHADKIFAVRTAEMSNHCHCSTCGYVWRDEDPPQPVTSDIVVRPKRDRRELCNHSA